MEGVTQKCDVVVVGIGWWCERRAGGLGASRGGAVEHPKVWATALGSTILVVMLVVGGSREDPKMSGAYLEYRVLMDNHLTSFYFLVRSKTFQNVLNNFFTFTCCHLYL